MRASRIIISSLFVLSLPLLTAGCSTQTGPSEFPLEEIYGSWDWIKSVGGFAGETKTPSSTGYTMRLVFNTNGTFEWYRADTLMASARFTILRDECPCITSESVDIIHYADGGQLVNQEISLISSDTLSLVACCCDCYEDMYVRME